MPSDKAYLYIRYLSSINFPTLSFFFQGVTKPVGRKKRRHQRAHKENTYESNSFGIGELKIERKTVPKCEKNRLEIRNSYTGTPTAAPRKETGAT